MASPLLAPEVLTVRLGDLQRRARTLHGDVTDRSIRAKLRALSVQIRQVSATLSAPGVLAGVIASELLEASLIVLQQLEQDAHRPLGDAR
jgi:hypothetical protein